MAERTNAAWRAVADPTRRRLIELLRDGPKTTGELCGAFGTSRFAVMKHLAVLERSGLLEVRRQGRHRWNSLNGAALQALGSRWSPSRPSGEPLVEHSAALPEAHRIQVFIDAVPWRVFDALTTDVAAWWGAPYLRSAEATNLVVEAQPGGRFFEEWGHRQGVLRGVVSAIRRDDRLDLAGALWEEDVESRLSFGLQPREGGTLLTVTATRSAAETVDALVRDRLKPFVERGARSGIAR